MIRCIKRNELNIEKYDNCIESSINSRIYAYSWYLDSVADQWEVLVLNNYDAVMPLPWKQKYFIKYVYPPAWTQQLGIFSKNEISEKLILNFIKTIPKKFKKITIQFNAGNIFEYKNVITRKNYILPLNKPYKEILKGFSKNRKRDLQKAIKTSYIIDKDIKPTVFLDFYLNELKNYKLNKNQIVALKYLLNSKNKTTFIWGIRNKEKLIASLLWLKDSKRITYLLPAATNESKNSGLHTLIISTLIEEFSNSNYVIDFEGSMISSVAHFYQSFGAEEEEYYFTSNYAFL